MPFQGELYYDDDPHRILMHIVPQNNGAICQATTTWSDGNQWVFHGHLALNGGGLTSDPIYTTNAVTGARADCTTRITLQIIEAGDGADIVGLWEENGESWKFSGFLERVGY